MHKAVPLSPPVVIDNPFWDLIATYPGPRIDIDFDPWSPDSWPLTPDLRRDPRYPRREELARQYSWAIPHPEAVSWIAARARGSVLDVGAGTGYWAWLLAQHGLDVRAVDVAPPSLGANPYHHGGTGYEPEEWTPVREFVPVQPVDAGVVVQGYASMLLSWPPQAGPMAENALRACTADTVFYIGELDGGCTGTTGMWELLERDWEPIELCPSHVSWYGIHDVLVQWQRR